MFDQQIWQESLEAITYTRFRGKNAEYCSGKRTDPLDGLLRRCPIYGVSSLVPTAQNNEPKMSQLGRFRFFLIYGGLSICFELRCPHCSHRLHYSWQRRAKDIMWLVFISVQCFYFLSLAIRQCNPRILISVKETPWILQRLHRLRSTSHPCVLSFPLKLVLLPWRIDAPDLGGNAVGQ